MVLRGGTLDGVRLLDEATVADATRLLGAASDEAIDTTPVETQVITEKKPAAAAEKKPEKERCATHAVSQFAQVVSGAFIVETTTVVPSEMASASISMASRKYLSISTGCCAEALTAEFI